LNSCELSCTHTVEYYLNNIKKKKVLNAFITVFSDDALKRAENIDYKPSKEVSGRVAGLIIAV